MAGFTIAVLVRNQPGVLNRVTSMFRRRRFNINSLTVSETESNAYSRITITSNGEDYVKDQLINQLYKLPDVNFIKELDEKKSVSRELLLIKMEKSEQTYDRIIACADEFAACAVDNAEKSVILQITGNTEQIDAFIKRMKEFKILEICRTGVVSLERGAETIRQEE